MEQIKNKQLSQKYTKDNEKDIIKEASKQHLDVATFIRKCVLDTIEANKK